MNKNIKKWLDKNYPHGLSNKNVFITGGNSGIGFELAKECAYLNANIFLLVRNAERGTAAKDAILAEYPNVKIELIKLDLSSFESIRNCVEEVKKYDVDYFVNNAGVYRLPKSETKDHFEITMGTNFIGTLYLNDLLIPYFLTLNHDVKDIFTSSVLSKIYKINHDDFYLEKNYKPFKIYGLSKTAINDLYYNYLDEYPNTNILFGISHPGITYTQLINKGYNNKFFVKLATGFMKLFFHSSSKAALSNLFVFKKEVKIGGPRGILGCSGYPHKTSFKKNKTYQKTVCLARSQIKEAIK